MFTRNGMLGCITLGGPEVYSSSDPKTSRALLEAKKSFKLQQLSQHYTTGTSFFPTCMVVIYQATWKSLAERARHPLQYGQERPGEHKQKQKPQRLIVAISKDTDS